MSFKDEAENAATVVFQNVDTVEGFQVYIVPYAQKEVSAKQLKRDEPSGVRTHVQAVTIGDVTGTAFDRSDSNLGDIHEVWFIRGGYLYEVTTLKPLEEWFAPILESWRFSPLPGV